MTLTKRTILLAITLALAVMLIAAVITTLATNMPVSERLANGGFESGFAAINGCGMVGSGWGCFTSGGRADYGFYDEGWAPAVAGGKHAQMIEINTKKDAVGQGSTAGIYQSINVTRGQVYALNFQALMRADDLANGGDPWRYVMLVGFSHDGGTDWTKASWQEVNVGPIQDRANPTAGYTPVHVQVTAQGDRLTVFIAGRMKWGDWNREVDFDIDNVSLQGPPPPPMPVDPPVVVIHPPHHPPAPGHPHPPVVVIPPTQPPVMAPPMWPPIVPPQLVCDGPNLLANGNFEYGFAPSGTGNYWAAYNNGGGANYGYYDDTWAPVVAEGKHAQLLEINSKGVTPQADRWIGVYQPMWNLKPGATYQLSFKTMIREEAAHADEDAGRYEVHWGYRAGPWPIANVGDLTSKTGVPVSGISARTSPSSYSSYTTTFVAPNNQIVLYLLGLKKWATPDREVDFDFDDVQLRPCRSTGGVMPPPPPPNVCKYMVVKGDTLSAIAKRHHTTVAQLARANGLHKPYVIHRRMVLIVPCKQGHVAMSHPHDDGHAYAAPADACAQCAEAHGGARIHIVKRGETLSQIAAKYGCTVKALRQFNNIRNVNRIRPGQQILIPA